MSTPKIVTGTFFKTRKLAEEGRKNKPWGKRAFEIIRFKTGYLVLSKRQWNLIK